MRVSEARYSRDLRRIELAIRFVRHEARTGTICAWTGLSADRVRRIYHTTVEGGRVTLVRHRGPSPRATKNVLLSIPLRTEAAIAAVLAQAHGVLPSATGAKALRDLPSVERGERLCLAYETYRSQVPNARLSLEIVLAVLQSLIGGVELKLGRCRACDAAILIDGLGRTRQICGTCLIEDAAGISGVREGPPAMPALSPAPESLFYQHSLF